MITKYCEQCGPIEFLAGTAETQKCNICKQPWGERPVPNEVTRDIAPLKSFVPPMNMWELRNQNHSGTGHSAVSGFLSCPERSRLRSMKIRRKPSMVTEGILESIDALTFGSLIHAMLATRVVYGNQVMLGLLDTYEILEEDRMKASNMLRVYDSAFPLEQEPFEYLGVESHVVSDIGNGNGGPCLRTCRYDSLIRYANQKAVFSLENKTDRSGGDNAMMSYMSQFITQYAIWNSNPFLVEKYGPMLGVLPNILIKTKVPQAERLAPRYFSNLHMQRAIEYLRLPDQVPYKLNSDGSYPRMLHSCFGRYAPCEYIGLCLEGNHGDYEQAP